MNAKEHGKSINYYIQIAFSRVLVVALIVAVGINFAVRLVATMYVIIQEIVSAVQVTATLSAQLVLIVNIALIIVLIATQHVITHTGLVIQDAIV